MKKSRVLVIGLVLLLSSLFVVGTLAAASANDASAGGAAVDNTPQAANTLMAAGGPDAFGYVYADSNEPGGPIYNFENISDTGTLVSLSDDQISAAIPVGFSFEFYGQSYSNIYIGSNGFLTVLSGQSTGCCTGQDLPDPNSPNGVISGWWEDLDPGNAGAPSRIHYQTLGTAPNRYFIVQFTTVEHFPSGDLVTFQYKFFENSDLIEVHYQDAPPDTSGGNLHTAGIENTDGTIGLIYTRTLNALPTPLAVSYQVITGLNILKRSSAGIVQVGDTFNYNLAVRSTKTANGSVVMTDVLPAEVSYVSAVASQGSCVDTAGTVTCDLGAMAVDSLAGITITVMANSYGFITNTAVVTGTGPDLSLANNSSSAQNLILPAEMPPLYGSSYFGPTDIADLNLIDPADGSSTLIGPTGYQRLGALELDLTTGVLYGGGVSPTVPAGTELLAIDTGSGASISLGATGMGNNHDLSLRNGDGMFYAHGFAGQRLGNIYTMNLGVNTTANLVGPTGLNGNGNGLAFSPGDTLYHADDGGLNIINQAAGTAALALPLNYLGSTVGNERINGMDFLPGTDLLFVSINIGGERAEAGSTHFLGVINIANGDVWVVGPTVVGLDALAFGPSPGSITIVKAADPQDGTDFDFDGGSLGAFTLDDALPDDADGISNTQVFTNLLPGVYAITETLPAGWSLESITCTSNDTSDTPVIGADNVVIDLDMYEDITCTFANGQPAVAIGKQPDSQLVLTGNDAVFTIAVTNTGGITLTNLVVVDPLTPGCDNSLSDLGPGANTSYACTAFSVTADFTNTAVVSGTAVGIPALVVTDSDAAFVDVIDPAIAIAKTPDLQTIAVGDNAIFSITVTNTGDVALANVTVSDPLVAACDMVLGNMTPGAVVSYGCTAVAVTASFTNTAIVTGTAPIGPDVTASDTAVVVTVAPTDVTLTGFTGADRLPALLAWFVVVALAGLGLWRRRRLSAAGDDRP